MKNDGHCKVFKHTLHLFHRLFLPLRLDNIHDDKRANLSLIHVMRLGCGVLVVCVSERASEWMSEVISHSFAIVTRVFSWRMFTKKCCSRRAVQQLESHIILDSGACVFWPLIILIDVWTLETGGCKSSVIFEIIHHFFLDRYVT